MEISRARDENEPMKNAKAKGGDNQSTKKSTQQRQSPDEEVTAKGAETTKGRTRKEKIELRR